MRILTRKIVGIILIAILLFQQAPAANAIFSPVLSSEVSMVKSHVQEARRQNGAGSFLNALEKATKASEELKAQGQASGLPGMFYLYMNLVKELIFNSLGNAFTDGFALLINYWPESGEFITNCLRDDIWELQALQEEVLNELLKSTLLMDVINTDILWADYNKLERWLKGGEVTIKKDNQEVKVTFAGLKGDYRNTSLLFPGGLPNYYAECPYGEFVEAWHDLKLSFDQLIMTFAGDTLKDWGSLLEMAKKRAKARANAWIAANQITLTLGGEKGGSPHSLLKGPGLEGFAADVRTEWEFVEAYGKMVGDSTWKEIADKWGYDENIDTIVEAYEMAEDMKQLVIDQSEDELKYNLQLNNVSEESLKSVEAILFKINKEIERAYKTDTSPDNLKKFCEQLSVVIKVQGKSKNQPVPSCK
ncbi:hypothetical protein JW752_00745 [Candidatus Peregrinibacteria bacterium]|nr:hypothetical protein [Candidatus Peregrinibacteria bacterium]